MNTVAARVQEEAGGCGCGSARSEESGCGCGDNAIDPRGASCRRCAPRVHLTDGPGVLGWPSGVWYGPPGQGVPGDHEDPAASCTGCAIIGSMAAGMLSPTFVRGSGRDGSGTTSSERKRPARDDHGVRIRDAEEDLADEGRLFDRILRGIKKGVAVDDLVHRLETMVVDHSGAPPPNEPGTPGVLDVPVIDPNHPCSPATSGSPCSTEPDADPCCAEPALWEKTLPTSDQIDDWVEVPIRVVPPSSGPPGGDPWTKLVECGWAVLLDNVQYVEWIACLMSGGNEEAGACLANAIEQQDVPITIDMRPPTHHASAATVFHPWISTDGPGLFDFGVLGIDIYAHVWLWELATDKWQHGSVADQTCACVQMAAVLLHELAHVCLRDIGDAIWDRACPGATVIEDTFLWTMSQVYPEMQSSSCCDKLSDPSVFLSTRDDVGMNC